MSEKAFECQKFFFCRHVESTKKGHKGIIIARCEYGKGSFTTQGRIEFGFHESGDQRLEITGGDGRIDASSGSSSGQQQHGVDDASRRYSFRCRSDDLASLMKTSPSITLPTESISPARVSISNGAGRDDVSAAKTSPV